MTDSVIKHSYEKHKTDEPPYIFIQSNFLKFDIFRIQKTLSKPPAALKKSLCHSKARRWPAKLRHDSVLWPGGKQIHKTDIFFLSHNKSNWSAIRKKHLLWSTMSQKLYLPYISPQQKLYFPHSPVITPHQTMYHPTTCQTDKIKFCILYK